MQFMTPLLIIQYVCKDKAYSMFYTIEERGKEFMLSVMSSCTVDQAINIKL